MRCVGWREAMVLYTLGEAVGGSEAYKGWPQRKRDKLISHEDRKLGFTQEGLINVPETLTQ